MASIGWNFPSNNNGEEDGLNDPGIETFRDDPLRFLAREGAQNSIDAPADPESDTPVEIHFDRFSLPISKFPDAAVFLQHLKACQQFWSTNEPTNKFFRKAIRLIQGKRIPVLRMADYNTTGLLGSAEDRNSDWFKLTKAVGASDKAGRAGGSFGIGKHAPFACSTLRTILYGTKDLEGRTAFQGVSKLVTHKHRKYTTQGTGYYGARERNTPLFKPSQVDRVFRRTKVGTDVFILGFAEEDDWAAQIVKGLIQSFFVAIYEGRLIARVADIPVNKNSLPELVTKYMAENRASKATVAYYEALTSEKATLFSQDDFEGLGRVELRVLPGKEYPKRVALVRSTGMMITDKSFSQTPLRYAGVLVAKGDNLNALLKSMEPPSHASWEAARAEDQARGRFVLRCLYAWVQDCVKTLSHTAKDEELDAEGISDYLPDDLDQSERGLGTMPESRLGEPAEKIEIETRTHEIKSGVPRGGAEEAGVDPLGDEGAFPEGEGANGGSGGRDIGGTEGTGGSKGSEGKGSRPTPRPIRLKAVRVYCSDPEIGKYRIMCEPETSEEGYLAVQVIGEVGEDSAPIMEAWVNNKRQPPGARVGTIGPLNMQAGERVTVDIVLKDALHCALGVAAYAN